ncbi:FitA-like ribbon-helix-helix domain-containing protein [Haloferula sp. A504]|uniref:FitA-like ribbon-helix-helix domain-containing protein n=1 Tax=Haloferula sp. A504 TaxID=3373601 RepID=UPI0031BFC3A7|nr:Arc family DNA-binding protein [Verrucomicrobiaceae bacterium E54]
MADLLIRNLPADLHARLKVVAASHRRSINQEVIATIEKALLAAPLPRAMDLPDPIRLKGPALSAEDTQRFIDDDIEARGY